MTREQEDIHIPHDLLVTQPRTLLLTIPFVLPFVLPIHLRRLGSVAQRAQQILATGRRRFSQVGSGSLAFGDEGGEVGIAFSITSSDVIESFDR